MRLHQLVEFYRKRRSVEKKVNYTPKRTGLSTKPVSSSHNWSCIILSNGTIDRRCEFTNVPHMYLQWYTFVIHLFPVTVKPLRTLGSCVGAQ